MRGRRSGGPRDERGQATVELALVLPLLLVLVLLGAQVGLVVRDQVLLVHATREAARAAAVGDTRPPLWAGGLDPARLHVTVHADGGDVRALASYRTPVVVPLLAALRRDITLRAQLVMRREGG